MAAFGRPMAMHEKAQRADIVTETDRESERTIVARLRADFPDASFVAEESGLQRGSATERWIVDPIDGTTNFAHGYPIFSISIAYERDGVVTAGVIYAPALDEMFTATLGSGARCNGIPIAVSAVADIDSALTCTGFQPATADANIARFEAMSKRAQGVRRDGSAALDLAYVAAGRFDAFWESDLHAWDVAAGMLLVTEAGGRVTRIDGGPATLEGASLLASNARIHDDVLAALA